jgi:hypothetical protein
MPTTTVFVPPIEVEHKFKVGDTIDVVYAWQRQNGYSGTPNRKTISKVELDGVRNTPLYRFTSGGFDAIADIDDFATLVPKYPCHLKVGDKLVGGGDGFTYTVIEVNETKFNNVRVEWISSRGDRHTSWSPSTGSWIDKAELNPPKVVTPDATYTITIKQYGAGGLHNIAFPERMAALLRSDRCYIEDGESFEWEIKGESHSLGGTMVESGTVNR